MTDTRVLEAKYFETYVEKKVVIDNIPDIGDKTGEAFLKNLEDAVAECRKLIKEGFRLVDFWEDPHTGIEFILRKKKPYDPERKLVWTNKLLLPTDGSANALRAARYAANLIKNNPDKKVTILYVRPRKSDWANYSWIVEDKVDAGLDELAREALEKTKKVFEEEGVPEEALKSEVLTGDPGRVIVRYAKDGEFGQIIMGTRGLGKLKGIILGSVSHQVLYMSEIPVLLIK